MDAQLQGAQARNARADRAECWRSAARGARFLPVIALVAAALLALAWILLLAGVEPVPTWFYVFAWYPTLVLLDRAAAGLRGRAGGQTDGRTVLASRGSRLLLGWNWTTLSLFAWSAPIWLVFEAANLRLANWYYVSLPAHLVARWAGTLLSFATVVPAIVLAERLLNALGVGRRWHGRAMVLRPVDLVGSVLLGVAMLGGAFGWPRLFFPFVWGGVWLAAEPVVARRAPAHSLYMDLARGDWGRIGRLAIGGLGIGVVWECYNFWARGRWIYTVPWLEHTKLFEMPPPGFLGFPFFALEAWAVYHTLVALGVATAPQPGWAPAQAAPPKSNAAPKLGLHRGIRRTILAALLAALFAAVVLLGMERRTISSVTPRPGSISTATEALVKLKGIGATHAATLGDLGVTSICALSRRDPEELFREIDKTVPRGAGRRLRPTYPEVRVWVGAARRECD